MKFLTNSVLEKFATNLPVPAELQKKLDLLLAR